MGIGSAMSSGYNQAVRWCLPAPSRRSEKVCSFTHFPLSPSFAQYVSFPFLVVLNQVCNIMTVIIVTLAATVDIRWIVLLPIFFGF